MPPLQRTTLTLAEASSLSSVHAVSSVASAAFVPLVNAHRGDIAHYNISRRSTDRVRSHVAVEYTHHIHVFVRWPLVVRHVKGNALIPPRRLDPLCVLPAASSFVLSHFIRWVFQRVPSSSVCECFVHCRLSFSQDQGAYRWCVTLCNDSPCSACLRFRAVTAHEQKDSPVFSFRRDGSIQVGPW
jgi:hypothetical protein